jgi:hypothetical protein
MKNLLTICIFFSFANGVSAQGTDTNYGLPSNATDISNIVSNTPGFMLSLQEGGSVPSETKSTCDGKSDGIFKSTTGLSLQHYYDKEQLRQMNNAYVSVGGMKGMFVKSQEDGYSDFENGMHPGPVLKKGEMQMGEVQGAMVSYFTVTYGCIQNDNPDATATKTIYHAMLLTDNNYLLITNEIYSANADLAKKYTEEIITKIKALNYEKVN